MLLNVKVNQRVTKRASLKDWFNYLLALSEYSVSQDIFEINILFD